MDFDKYVDFYKWIDHSITSMLQQLMPASANMAEGLRTVVESHVLERNKYWNKFPTLDAGKKSNIEGGVSEIGGHLTDEWKFGFATLPSSLPKQNVNSLWWKNRADRTELSITSGDATVDKNRNTILSASSPAFNNIVSQGRTHKSSFKFSAPIHAGSNSNPNKNYDFFRQNTSFGLARGDAAATATITITDYTELNAGDKVNLVATDGTNYDFEQGDQSSVNGTFEATTSNNQTATNLMNVINTSSGPSGTRFNATVDGAVVTVTQAVPGTAGNTTVTLTDSGTAGMSKTDFTGGTITSPLLGAIVASDVEDFIDCLDEPFPNVKRSYSFKLADSSSAEDYDTAGKGDLLVPFSLYSSSVSTGYAADISSSFKAGVDFTNIHVDALSDIPMQGPFTEKYVGGNQHRHVDINKFDTAKSTANNIDGQTNRTEGFYIELGPDSNVVSLVGSDYYSTDLPRATLTREEYTKRPVNIRNIKQAIWSI